MTGPDTAGLAELLGQISVPVIASGGVGSMADLLTLAELSSDRHGVERRLEGVIAGKAIYAGAFTVSQAVAVLAELRK